MKLDLYSSSEFTKDGVRRLLASKTGSESSHGLYQLRVTRDGIAYIEHNAFRTSQSEWQSHCVMFEKWNRSYVGKDAASDDEWVTQVHKMLKSWWNECLEFGPHRLPEAFYADYTP